MSSVSIDLELALELLGKELTCPDCGEIYSLSQTKESLNFELSLESLKDEKLIQNSMKNPLRLLDDC